jgi:hypothetical protein
MPPGTVLLYALRDGRELQVCQFHFFHAYEYARKSVEVSRSQRKARAAIPPLLKLI